MKRRANPPTKPATAVSPPSSSPSGNRSTNASARSIPAAKAAAYDLPLVPNSPPSRASRLAAEKPTAASKAIRTVLTAACHPPAHGRTSLFHAPLGAPRAPPVNLEAVRADLEAPTEAGKVLQVHGTRLELRDAPTTLADKVMVVILSQLVARTATKVEPAYQPQLGEKI